MLEHFDTLHQYFIATLAHWTLCALAGAMILHSHIRGGIVLRWFATLLATWWCLYEIMEYQRIQDQVDIDLANGLAAFIAGFALAWLYHYKIRKWLTRWRGPYP